MQAEIHRLHLRIAELEGEKEDVVVRECLALPAPEIEARGAEVQSAALPEGRIGVTAADDGANRFYFTLPEPG